MPTPAGGDSRVAWEAALAAMEDELNENEAAVRNGSTTQVPAWDPPEDLGPLPTELADRARNLQSRVGVLTTFVKYQLQALDADLDHVRRQEHKGTTNKTIALFLDASV